MSKTITIRRKRPSNIVELADLWPSYEAMAEDLGLTLVSIYAMRNRNSISPRHWRKLVRSAKKHGIDGITIELLMELAEERMAS